MSIHRASSSTWGDEAVPRLCSLIVESNKGIAQQVAENRTDLLDILPSKLLSVPTDDLGLTPAFLAVYYDRPEMIEYLHKRGVDFTKPCDTMGYGTPMFYAISLGRTRLIGKLDAIGASIDKACDQFGQLPLVHAKRIDNQSAVEAIHWAAGKEMRAAVLFDKHFKRIRCRKRYLSMLKAIPLLLRVVRGLLGRRFVMRKIENLNTLARREARRLQREYKIAEGMELDADDEDTVAEVEEEEDGAGGLS